MPAAGRSDSKSKLSIALGAALALHAAVAGLGQILERYSKGTSTDLGHVSDAPPSEIDIVDVVTEAVQGAAEESSAPLDTPVEPAPRVAARSPRASNADPMAPNTESRTPNAEAEPKGATGENAGQGESYSLNPTAEPSARSESEGAQPDLGIAPGSWSRYVDPTARVEAPPVPRERPAPAPVSSTGGLAEALEARDQAVGLGPAGPVLTAAHEAAYSDQAPGIGTATFSITVLRSGGIAVTLTGASSHQAEWQKVAETIAAAIRRKPPRISASRNGVRIGIELVAEEHWPNGAPTKSEGPALAVSPLQFHDTEQEKKALENENPFAVAPPGSPAEQPPLKAAIALPPGVWLKGRGKVCSYAVGITPLGPMIGGGCDPSNIGAKPRRVVSTRVVSQTML